MTDHLFSKAALPGVMNLMGRFNLALDQEIKHYETRGDSRQFGKILAHLSQDLAYFVENFVAWNQEIKTLDEQKQISQLESLLDQAKKLVAKAASLMESVH